LGGSNSGSCASAAGTTKASSNSAITARLTMDPHKPF